MVGFDDVVESAESVQVLINVALEDTLPRFIELSLQVLSPLREDLFLQLVVSVIEDLELIVVSLVDLICGELDFQKIASDE